MAKSEPRVQENGQRAGIFDFTTTPLLYATGTRRRRGFAGSSPYIVFPYINIVRALLGHFIFDFFDFFFSYLGHRSIMEYNGHGYGEAYKHIQVPYTEEMDGAEDLGRADADFSTTDGGVTRYLAGSDKEFCYHKHYRLDISCLQFPLFCLLFYQQNQPKCIHSVERDQSR